MPVDEIAGSVIGGLFRLILSFFTEIVFELLVKGLGYLACRPFSRRVDPDGLAVVLVGLMLWGLLIWSGFFLYWHVAG